MRWHWHAEPGGVDAAITPQPEEPTPTATGPAGGVGDGEELLETFDARSGPDAHILTMSDRVLFDVGGDATDTRYRHGDGTLGGRACRPRVTC